MNKKVKAIALLAGDEPTKDFDLLVQQKIKAYSYLLSLLSDT